MTSEQIGHMWGIIDETQNLIIKKYSKGVEEHGGNLWELSSSKILDEAINEAIDQVVYLITLKDKMGFSRLKIEGEVK
jgi:hypothetical protein